MVAAQGRGELSFLMACPSVSRTWYFWKDGCDLSLWDNPVHSADGKLVKRAPSRSLLCQKHNSLYSLDSVGQPLVSLRSLLLGLVGPDAKTSWEPEHCNISSLLNLASLLHVRRSRATSGDPGRWRWPTRKWGVQRHNGLAEYWGELTSTGNHPRHQITRF